jgi:regulator of cell morphogenesis and NO signaling
MEKRDNDDAAAACKARLRRNASAAQTMAGLPNNPIFAAGLISIKGAEKAAFPVTRLRLGRGMRPWPCRPECISFMNPETIHTTVGELVRAAPIRARIFEKLGVDYCCGGKKPLSEVCQTKDLDAPTVLAMLRALDTAPDPALVDADAMKVDALCAHIAQVHHDYLRQEIPRLLFMTRKVAAVHGGDDPRLVEIRDVFAAFAAELTNHIIEEEKTVFPRIIAVMRDGGPEDRASLRKSIDELQHEHESAGSALLRFRELTDGYSPPEWACNTFRAMYDGLARLERDMHQHVHKENNVLFARALA